MNIQTVDNVFSYFRSLVFKSRLLKPFSIYLEGSSYRESTVISKKNEKRKNNLTTCPLCQLFLCARCSSVPLCPTVPLCLLFHCSYVLTVLLCLLFLCSSVPLFLQFLSVYCSSVPTFPFPSAHCSSRTVIHKYVTSLVRLTPLISR